MGRRTTFTVADVHLYAFVDEMPEKGQPIPTNACGEGMDRARGARPAAEMSLWRWRSAEVPAAERPRVST